MTYLTWDGMRLFQKPETAATFALDNDMDPKKLLVLEGGQTKPAPRWEIEDLLAHMRDQGTGL